MCTWVGRESKNMRPWIEWNIIKMTQSLNGDEVSEKIKMTIVTFPYQPNLLNEKSEISVNSNHKRIYILLTCLAPD